MMYKYYNPFIYSFISITSGYSSTNFSINYLNLQSLKFISHKVLIIDSINEKNLI